MMVTVLLYAPGRGIAFPKALRPAEVSYTKSTGIYQEKNSKNTGCPTGKRDRRGTRTMCSSRRGKGAASASAGRAQHADTKMTSPGRAQKLVTATSPKPAVILDEMRRRMPVHAGRRPGIRYSFVTRQGSLRGRIKRPGSCGRRKRRNIASTRTKLGLSNLLLAHPAHSLVLGLHSCHGGVLAAEKRNGKEGHDRKHKQPSDDRKKVTFHHFAHLQVLH